jgi:hypothetical protein
MRVRAIGTWLRVDLNLRPGPFWRGKVTSYFRRRTIMWSTRSDPMP